MENSVTLNKNELESIVSDIYFVLKKEAGFEIINSLFYQLVIDILLSIYDQKEKNVISVLSCKIFFVIICQDKPRDKYHYLFQQIADHNNCVSRKRLHTLLKNIVSVIEFIGEGHSFGTGLIAGTIESCFEANNGVLGVTESSFIIWLMQDPQLLVWLSTLYRIQISETVSHDAKCATCKMYPIIGMRYHCLRCLSYDVCQICFFTGMSNKRHKLKHPVQEYCYPMTTSQSTKAFLLTLRNILYKKNSKIQYLPALEVGVNHDDSLDSTSGGCTSETQKICYKELQRIILQLEKATKQLIPQIQILCDSFDRTHENDGQNGLEKCIRRHMIQIENQIRLLHLLHIHLLSSKHFKTQPLIASTPVVQMNKENHNWGEVGLHALTPIRVMHSPTSLSTLNSKPEKKLMWDNYDFVMSCMTGKSDLRISWEEMRCESNRQSHVSSFVNEETKPDAEKNITNPDDGPQGENLSTLLAARNLFQDSESFSRRGYTWLRDSVDVPISEEGVESTIGNLRDDMKEILNKLHELSMGLTDKDNEKLLGGSCKKLDREIEAAQKVDSLLRELVTGIEKLIES
ncbi:hypothetical protein RUM43_005184 [Polyplax serrata]|uniref:ZZ-type domain-containing protein n=1 Tax=Polyplax serrata TaxID=468196 RepID=A0AAN8XMP6_POLSC